MAASTSTALIAAATGVAGAVLGFAGTFWVARRNLKKEISLKVAEYRISWINNLGEQISTFLACAIRVGFCLDGFEEKDLNSVRQEMIRSATRVDLLMNHQDEDYPKLKALMMDISRIVHLDVNNEEDQRRKIEKIKALDKEFVELSNKVLKREWSKTKRHLREDTVEVSALKSENIPPSA